MKLWRGLLAILLVIMMSGCDINDNGPKVEELEVVKATIIKGVKSYSASIEVVDMVRQLCLELNGYPSQNALYDELSDDDYKLEMDKHDIHNTYFIFIYLKDDSSLHFMVSDDGTVIKTVNEKNYICKVKADYDFIAGLELFAYKPKNKLAYDKTHVPEFLSIFQSSYIPGTINEGTTFSEENCYQIYSTDLLKHLEYEVFKFADTCASYLLYKGEIYELGTWFGGYGVTDVAIDDLNEDGLDEIYFTYSWGSGTHWSVLEYFDTKDNTFHDLFATNTHFLEFMLIRTDLGLVVAEAYYTSAANNPLYFVDITLTYKSSLGEISYDDHIHLDHYQLDN